MNSENATSPQLERKKPFILFRAWQWVAVLALSVLLLPLASNYEMLKAPDAPLVQFWVAILAGALVLISLAPPVFFRLSKRGKSAAYGGLLVVFFIIVSAFGSLQSSYDKTPEGAKLAAIRKTEEAKEAAKEAERAVAVQRRKNVERALDELKDTYRKLDACFSWGKQIPALTNAVKGKLNNPNSFEHVETFLIEPESDGRNVAMTFRAQNGFGGVITSQVAAELTTDCEISNVSNPDK